MATLDEAHRIQPCLDGLSAQGSVVREIRTVTDDGSPTLAIVLAAIALAMALGAIAYAWVRLTRMQRDLSSRPLAG